jgi:dienelactone hydrolase
LQCIDESKIMFAVLAVCLVNHSTANITITTASDPTAVPERFRLPAGSFDVTVSPKYRLSHSNVEVLAVSFPSAVTSPHAENNTVYGEIFRPIGGVKTPAVIVFDILDGATIVSRGQAMWLAQHNITAMAITMAYYGPRRPPGTRLRMLMPDLEHSTAAVTQTVLDARRAIQFLATRPDIDSSRIGVVGTSLGSFIGGLVAASEPNVSHATLMLGGGGLVDAFYDHPKAKSFRALNESLGYDRQWLRTWIDPVDPLTYASLLKTKRLQFVAAKRDEVVPPKAMETLWRATSQPPILWLDSTHAGAAVHVFPIMDAVITHITK